MLCSIARQHNRRSKFEDRIRDKKIYKLCHRLYSLNPSEEEKDEIIEELRRFV